MNVFVTGIGCISPLGINVSENLAQLRKCEDGLVHPQFLSSRYASQKYFGEVPADNKQLLDLLQIEAFGMTRTDLLAFVAFRHAVVDANLTEQEISSNETAFISGSTVGGMCLTDQLYRDANLLAHDAEYVHSYNCAAHTLHISKQYGMTGFSDTINTACSSSANAIMLGARLIKSGRYKRAIVGGVDSLAKYTVNGFNALQILSDEKCMPFDEHRSGLNLGEAGAYLVLEAEDCSDKPKYATVSGYGNTNDAYHTSSMSDTAIGVTTCMRSALQQAQLKASDIDYINAHGTGTQNNDIVEFTGFKNVFGDHLPLFSSTKSFTGHTLGAAGSLEAIFSILSLSNGELYPSLRVLSALEHSAPHIVREFTSGAELKHIMSNSYGFGGNCTSLIFSKA